MPFVIWDIARGAVDCTYGLFRKASDAEAMIARVDISTLRVHELTWSGFEAARSIQTLRSTARVSARAHGHRLGTFRAWDNRAGPQSAVCVHTGCCAGATVTPYPHGSETEVSGTAINHKCPYAHQEGGGRP